MTNMLTQPAHMTDDARRKLIEEYEAESRKALENSDRLMALLWADAAADQARRMAR